MKRAIIGASPPNSHPVRAGRIHYGITEGIILRVSSRLWWLGGGSQFRFGIFLFHRRVVLKATQGMEEL